MSGFVDTFYDIAKKAAKLSPENPGDYRADDGLLYCGKCHTQKQCRINLMGKEDIVGCLCKCEAERLDAEDRALKKREEMARVNSLRVRGIQDKAAREHTFDRADQTPEIIKCHRYVDRWPEMLRNNIGLMFWGAVGNGKTFAASCIANALIDRGIPVLVTSFPRILNAGWDKSEIISQMSHFPLMVIDDLGTERKSEYAQEIVYSVVDERYKAGKPLIITTNLTYAEIKAEENMSYQRIYSRILEMCTPIQFRGVSRRTNIASGKKQLAKEIFG